MFYFLNQSYNLTNLTHLTQRVHAATNCIQNPNVLYIFIHQKSLVQVQNLRILPQLKR